MKELNRYCDYHKEGFKIIIDKIYNEPLEKEDLRKYNGLYLIKRYKQLNIKDSEWDNIGIYYILKDNDIYIGSTISGFRKRFQDHYYGYDKNMKHTYNMLQSEATFNILHDMTGIIDEMLIRRVEQEYMNYFKNYTNYNVINIKENTYSVQKKDRIKYKTLKVKLPENEYKQALQLLINNGYIKES